MSTQWRLSWEMWPHGWPRAQRTEKVYDNEAEAMRHLEGLRSIQANHPPRPCGKHVWDIKVETRETDAWQESPQRPGAGG